MALDPIRERQLLREEVDQIAAMDPAKFSLGAYNGNLMADIKYILWAYQRLAQCSLDRVFDGDLPSLRENAGNTRAVLKQYLNEAVPNDQEQERRAGNLVSGRKHVNTVIIPRLSFYGTSLRDAEESLSAIKKRAEEGFREVDGILAATKAAAGEVSVARYVKIFGKQAGRDSKAAWCWFAGTLGSGAATLWATYALFAHFRDLKTDAHGYSIPLGILSLAIVSILSFLFVWCARTYRAYLHNAAMNLHRHNALMTFEAFAKQAEHDPAAKMALLSMAANAIFMPQNTGFVGGRESLPTPQSHVIEMFRPTGGK